MFILTCIVVTALMQVAAPSHHKCNRYEGICQKKHIACDGVYIKGLCCGGEHIQCCLAGDRGPKGQIGCNDLECHTRCRNGNNDAGIKFLTGYCKWGIICVCSNDCRLVDDAAAKCLALCLEKGFANGLCSHKNHLCHCGN